MDSNIEQRKILDEIDQKCVLGKGASWKKFNGDVTCRVIADHIQGHLPPGYKIVGPNAYLVDHPIEFDLMVAKKNARRVRSTNAYSPEDIVVIIEIKRSGIFNYTEEMREIRAKFDGIKGIRRSIKSMYLTGQEASIIHDDTRDELKPYPAFILRTSNSKGYLKGQWRKFIGAILRVLK